MCCTLLILICIQRSSKGSAPVAELKESGNYPVTIPTSAPAPWDSIRSRRLELLNGVEVPVAPLPYLKDDPGPITRSMLGPEVDEVRDFSVSSTAMSVLDWKLRHLVREEEALSEAEDLGVLHNESIMSDPIAETMRVPEHPPWHLLQRTRSSASFLNEALQPSDLWSSQADERGTPRDLPAMSNISPLPPGFELDHAEYPETSVELLHYLWNSEQSSSSPLHHDQLRETSARYSFMDNLGVASARYELADAAQHTSVVQQPEALSLLDELLGSDAPILEVTQIYFCRSCFPPPNESSLP